MKIALLLVLLLPFILAEQSSIFSPFVTSGLTFSNVTGKGVTKEQVESFINLANYASRVYKDDIEKTTKFIKSRMD